MNRVNLSHANLSDANLSDANLSDANLNNANLNNANLRRANLSRSDLIKTNLIGASLSGANLERTNLREAYLSGVKLQKANLTQAQLVAANIVQADLRGVSLLGANLQGANLQGANLRRAYLVKANLKSTNLSWGRLQQVNLTSADLSQAMFYAANLSYANLSRANLVGADLRQATLMRAICEETQFIETKLSAASFYKADATGASFYKADAIGVDFQRVILTGTCIEDWNINSATNLKDVVCDYVYLKENSQERRPHGGSFQPGEFTQRFQKFLETVDLFFVDGVDWKAFLTSFQDLQSQYGDENLAVQGIERKGQSSFEIRLAVPPEADKAEIERMAYERYEADRQLREAQYQEQIAAKEDEITLYRQQADSLKDELLDAYRQQQPQNYVPDLVEVVKMLADRPITIDIDNKFEGNAVVENNSPKENNQTITVHGPVGNLAGTNTGNMSAIQNNYGSNAEDITRLLAALRDQAQTFPTDQKDDANDLLNDLDRDLADEQPDQGRIGRRLKKLVALGAAIGTFASGAAAVTGDLNDFTSNVIELTEQLGIPVEQVQLPPSGTP